MLRSARASSVVKSYNRINGHSGEPSAKYSSFMHMIIPHALHRPCDWLALPKKPTQTNMDSATAVRDLLFTLLLKVGVASSIAALLARWNTFRRVLFTEERDPDQKLKLMLFMTPPLILGVRCASSAIPTSSPTFRSKARF